MSLENLVKTGQLKPHHAADDEIAQLFAAATRNLADATVAGISDVTRFDVAYKCIVQCASAALMVAGYRCSTNVPGHHQTMIATLRLTLGIPNERLVVLDALRRLRNINDYSGGAVEGDAVRECIACAETLHEEMRVWLGNRRPGTRG